MIMNKTLIFGREPAVWVGAIQSALVLLVGFGALDFIGLDSPDDIAIVVAVLGAAAALYLAYVTSETLLAPLIEATKAVLALGAIYGLNITVEQTGLLIGAITMLMSLYQRDRVEPLLDPAFTSFKDRAATDEEMEVDFDGDDIEDDPVPDDDDLSTLPTTHDHGGVVPTPEPVGTVNVYNDTGRPVETPLRRNPLARD